MKNKEELITLLFHIEVSTSIVGFVLFALCVIFQSEAMFVIASLLLIICILCILVKFIISIIDKIKRIERMRGK